jgi:hypothetical protein
MSGFLLDTNVLSEFNRRGEPDYNVKQWLVAADTNPFRNRGRFARRTAAHHNLTIVTAT